MTALSGPRATPSRDGKRWRFAALSGNEPKKGALVMINSSGVARAGATATGMKGVGVAITDQVEDPGFVTVERGHWLMKNSASTDEITAADYGNDCWIVDDQTVAKTGALVESVATRSVAGKIRGVTATGDVWVEF